VINLSSKKIKELYNQSNEFINKRKFEEALATINRLLEIDPKHAKGLAKLGYVHYRLGFKYISREEVLKLNKKALGLNDQSSITWNCLGIAYSNAELYNEALECFETSLAINPKFSKALTSMGTVFFKMGKYKKAIKYFQDSLEVDPKNVDAIHNIAITYLRLLKFKKVIHYAREALNIDQEYPDVWDTMGTAYFLLNNYKKAISCYQTVLELDPHYLGAWYNLADVFIKQKRYDSAINYYKKALELADKLNIEHKSSEYIKILCDLGEAYWRKKDINKAIECCREALEIDRKNYYAKSFLEKLHFRGIPFV